MSAFLWNPWAETRPWRQWGSFYSSGGKFSCGRKAPSSVQVEELKTQDAAGRSASTLTSLQQFPSTYSQMQKTSKLEGTHPSNSFKTQTRHTHCIFCGYFSPGSPVISSYMVYERFNIQVNPQTFILCNILHLLLLSGSLEVFGPPRFIPTVRSRWI